MPDPPARDVVRRSGSRDSGASIPRAAGAVTRSANPASPVPAASQSSREIQRAPQERTVSVNRSQSAVGGKSSPASPEGTPAATNRAVGFKKVANGGIIGNAINKLMEGLPETSDGPGNMPPKTRSTQHPFTRSTTGAAGSNLRLGSGANLGLPSRSAAPAATIAAAFNGQAQVSAARQNAIRAEARARGDLIVERSQAALDSISKTSEETQRVIADRFNPSRSPGGDAAVYSNRAVTLNDGTDEGFGPPSGAVAASLDNPAQPGPSRRVAAEEGRPPGPSVSRGTTGSSVGSPGPALEGDNWAIPPPAPDVANGGFGKLPPEFAGGPSSADSFPSGLGSVPPPPSQGEAMSDFLRVTEPVSVNSDGFFGNGSGSGEWNQKLQEVSERVADRFRATVNTLGPTAVQEGLTNFWGSRLRINAFMTASEMAGVAEKAGSDFTESLRQRVSPAAEYGARFVLNLMEAPASLHQAWENGSALMSEKLDRALDKQSILSDPNANLSDPKLQDQ